MKVSTLVETELATQSSDVVEYNKSCLPQIAYHALQVVHSSPCFVFAKLADYLQLVKFKLSTLVTVTTALGYLIGQKGSGSDGWGQFALTLLGSFLVVGAANAFNQILERDTDALMERTKNRPLPAGRMSLVEALLAASIMSTLGLTILTFASNPLTSALALMALAIYALAYTPLKRKSEFCIPIGAISGAIPPMMGWVAARGELGQEALALFALQFLWQFPHFWAIAWMYQSDYKRLNFKVLPFGGKPSYVAFLTTIFAIATTTISAYPAITGQTSFIYTFAAIALGMWLIGTSVRFYKAPTHANAKNLLCVADTYLPLVLLLWFLAKQI